MANTYVLHWSHAAYQLPISRARHQAPLVQVSPLVFTYAAYFITASKDDINHTETSHDLEQNVAFQKE
jgi:hypothetical protein